jgi:hypothetical protein
LSTLVRIVSAGVPRAVSALAMLSKVDMWGKRAKFWNAMPMPRSSGGASVTSRPSRRMAPLSGTSTPATRRRRTVLPVPDGPKITRISPLSADSETSSRILAALKPLETR